MRESFIREEMRIQVNKNLMWLFLLIAVAACGKKDEKIADSLEDPFTWVFRSGTEGYACHRVVALVVTGEGTLLAFSEGRVLSCSDETDTDIVMKRSTDGGVSWSPLMVIENDGPNPCKDPCPVVLPNGRILLVYSWNESIPSEDDRTTREVYLTYSDDDGLTWAESRNITNMVYPGDRGWSGTGPGHGIVKERDPYRGRIVVAARHNPPGPGMSRGHLICSDDNGETWFSGAIALRDRTSESAVVELSDGSIMLNSRNGIDGQPYRVVSISSDGGDSFDKTFLDIDLIEPNGCQGSILNHSFIQTTGKSNIIFSNPHHTVERVNGTLKWSEDDGETWTKKFMYSNPYPAYSGYSDIAIINGKDIAVLFEAGPSYIKGMRHEGVAFRIVTPGQFEPIKK